MGTRSLKMRLRFLAVGLLLAFQYQNCSSYGDPNPFQLSSDILPQSTPEAVSLSMPDLGSGSSQEYTLAVGGSCNVGLEAAQHWIELSLKNNNQTIVISPDLNACADENFSQACTMIKTICEHGRYHLTIPVQRIGFCPGWNQSFANIQISAQLVIVDGSGIESRPTTAGYDGVLYNLGRADREYACP